MKDGRHSHYFPKRPEGHFASHPLIDDELKVVHHFHKVDSTPCEQWLRLKEQNPNLSISINFIYNLNKELTKEHKGGRPIMQVLVDDLEEHNSVTIVEIPQSYESFYEEILLGINDLVKS